MTELLHFYEKMTCEQAKQRFEAKTRFFKMTFLAVQQADGRGREVCEISACLLKRKQ